VVHHLVVCGPLGAADAAADLVERLSHEIRSHWPLAALAAAALERVQDPLGVVTWLSVAGPLAQLRPRLAGCSRVALDLGDLAGLLSM
jgi:hypothetical protein